MTVLDEIVWRFMGNSLIQFFQLFMTLFFRHLDNSEMWPDAIYHSELADL
jgi:hypothetical protein